MIQIPREIRKKLETSLPSFVLEFLNEKFVEAERYCEKAKELESKVLWLEEQLKQRDEMMMQLYYQAAQGSQGSQNSQDSSQDRKSIGYQYGNQPYTSPKQNYRSPQFPQQFPSMHYMPWEDLEEFERERFYPEAQRGGRGGGRGGRGGGGGSRNDFAGNFTMQRGGQGGNQGGGGSNQGGGQGSQGGGQSGGGGNISSEFGYIPEPEKVEKRIFPMEAPMVPLSQPTDPYQVDTEQVY